MKKFTRFSSVADFLPIPKQAEDKGDTLVARELCSHSMYDQYATAAYKTTNISGVLDRILRVTTKVTERFASDVLYITASMTQAMETKAPFCRLLGFREDGVNSYHAGFDSEGRAFACISKEYTRPRIELDVAQFWLLASAPDSENPNSFNTIFERVDFRIISREYDSRKADKPHYRLPAYKNDGITREMLTDTLLEEVVADLYMERTYPVSLGVTREAVIEYIGFGSIMSDTFDSLNTALKTGGPGWNDADILDVVATVSNGVVERHAIFAAHKYASKLVVEEIAVAMEATKCPGDADDVLRLLAALIVIGPAHLCEFDPDLYEQAGVSLTALEALRDYLGFE